MDEEIKIDFALFFARTEKDIFLCVKDHPQLQYRCHESYATWEITSLMRLLAQNQKILSEKLISEVFPNSKGELCLLVKWEPNLRLIALFQFKSEDKATIAAMSSRREELYQIAIEYLDRNKL